MTRNRPLRRAAPRPSGFAIASLAAAVLAACIVCSPAQAQAFDPGRPDIAQFIAEVSQKHGFEPGPLAATFARMESKPAILQAISRPAERTLNWSEYRARFLTDQRIARGVALHGERGAELQRAAQSTGVPAPVLLAITGVETLYGQNTGRFRVADALATLAFDYAPRATFFRGELEQFLLMAREEQLDPLDPLGSYAGAMGIPQFMPTSFRKWAVDGDDDGHRDLWNDWADVFASVGNYLKAHGWEAGRPVMVPADVANADLAGLELGKIGLPETVGSLRKRGIRFDTDLPEATPAALVALPMAFGNEYRVGFANFHAITRYNRSHLYASAVADLAEAIGAGVASAPAAAPPSAPPAAS